MSSIKPLRYFVVTWTRQYVTLVAAHEPYRLILLIKVVDVSI